MTDERRRQLEAIIRFHQRMVKAFRQYGQEAQAQRAERMIEKTRVLLQA